jgi:membrane fusion protein (multidrug efflux system)
MRRRKVVTSKMRIKLFLITLCAASIGFGCAGSGERGEASVSQQVLEERATPVEVIAVERCDFEDAITATGRFEANEVVNISPEVAGRIQEMRFDEGDAVEKGDLIVKIEDSEVRLTLERARAELKRREADLLGAERALKRAHELYQKSIATEAHLDEAQQLYDVAQASVEQAKAEVGLAEKRLADTEIVAPLRGVLAERRYAVGELVQVGAPIFTLLQLSPIKLEIKVPERRIGELALDQEAVVTVDALNGTQYEGVISYISPSLDPLSKNLMVRLVVPNEDMMLKPGMFARASIDTGAHKNILAVPRDAILFASEETEVFVLADGVARKRRLSLGADWRELVEVTAGVTEGDEVITAGQHVLKDGMKVNVVARLELCDLLEGNILQ